jgi:hypothetical protein
MTKARNIADLGSNDVIETTATGVDVTGTVTADGLTVETTSPSIHITGADTSQQLIYFGGTTSDEKGAIRYSDNSDWMQFETDSVKRVRIDSGGDVSFYEDTGTTAKFVWDSSAESLNLGGISTTNTAGFSQNLAIKDLYPSITLEDTATGTGKWTLGVTEGGIGFWDNITTQYRMRINSSGNVGIGTASPSAKLEIASGTIKTTPVYSTGNFFNAFHSAPSAGGDGGLYMGAISPNNSDISSGGYYYSGGNYIAKDTTASKINLSNNGIIFSYNSGLTSGSTYAPSERARIDSSGNLLVGTTAKGHISAAHEIRGESSSGGISALTVANTTGTAECPALNVANRDTSTDSSNRFVQFYADYTGSSPSVAMGGIVGNGSGSVQFATISDKREKENISSVGSVADKIKQLNVVEFDFIKTGDHVDYGFIAQDVQDVFPDFVVDNMANEGEEERLGLAGGMSSGYIAVLTKALQEALTKIEQLETRIETLENN